MCTFLDKTIDKSPQYVSFSPIIRLIRWFRIGSISDPGKAVRRPRTPKRLRREANHLSGFSPCFLFASIRVHLRFRLSHFSHWRTWRPWCFDIPIPHIMPGRFTQSGRGDLRRNLPFSMSTANLWSVNQPGCIPWRWFVTPLWFGDAG
jgi:hypothetical protein